MGSFNSAATHWDLWALCSYLGSASSLLRLLVCPVFLVSALLSSSDTRSHPFAPGLLLPKALHLG